ncbi:GPI ethanolamine phosphate transferase 3 [Eurytemora carolleeae]|uniref:GPI ethanolamine phosphate transferase 3 n=1 Tax=Eurytemora carolleeae TaxID=1294199 RepID=UPI000C7934A3|nr:GPI ethanolamine phosphate transferase 3 [Eurytemora carolleeae]XP_023344807.1 GPI ethanolamine phosphate transferase 3 [Eurytemora carolleeae]XP_023344808.1 GPI ethanolamine phosphate transferase 3 [Eurytemora carolleeae]|eukprot:XP_023344806.1 GPI ethanolamine phosphate transferase 3-like [Eurytemora affinis]
MASYWALQSFPSPLISKLLPWQHNLIVHTVLLLVLAGIFILVLNPRLVYFQTKKKNSSRIYRQENIPCYFNYMKANWRTTLSDKSTPSIPLGYGLGSCLSAPFISISVFFVFLSMLISGDGQCPAVLAQFLLMLGVIVITSQYRLYQMRSLSGLLDVSLPVLLPWILLDNLSFFTSGHQTTFPHIQWSAAFIGMEGSQIAGESYSGHILPALLITWNTFASSLLSSLLLPLLLLSPFSLYLLLPGLRHKQTYQTNGTAGVLPDAFCELEKGESVLLENTEETKSALFLLINKYILLKGVRLLCSMMAAAVLRRHLMVWKIFAPKFIFEAVGFGVSLLGLILGYLIFIRVLSVVSACYAKFKLS